MRRPRSCACRGHRGLSAPEPMRDRHVRCSACAGSPSRLGGARDPQVTSRRCGRARSALERRGGGEVREVAAARYDGVRHLVPRRRREARQRQREVGGRESGRPDRRAQRWNTAVGRATHGRQPLGCRRAKLLVAEHSCPQPRPKLLSRGTSGGARFRAGGNAGHARQTVDRPQEGSRYGQRRERLNYGEPEGGKQEHECNLKGLDAKAYPATIPQVSDLVASSAAGAARSVESRAIPSTRPSIRA